MTVRINKQKINLREKLAGVEDKVNFDEVVRGLGEYGGNVGIGTTNPGDLLEVGGGTGSANVTINHLAGTGANFRIENDGNLMWQMGVNTSGNINNDFVIDTSIDPGNPKFIIKSNGNVGIGTASPNAPLHIVGTPSSTLILERDSADVTAISSIILKDGSDDQVRISSTDSKFLFETGASNTPRMLVDSAGNVGIGTTNPGSYKLNINGTARVSSGDVTSDDRVKHNEQTIVGALETLSKITPKKYIKTTEMYDADHDFELDADGNPINENGEPVEHRIEAGVIAQQVLTVDELAFAVSPEGVDEDGTVTSPHGLDYNSLFTYAIAAIQEQQQLIDDLKSRIETLEQQ